MTLARKDFLVIVDRCCIVKFSKFSAATFLWFIIVKRNIEKKLTKFILLLFCHFFAANVWLFLFVCLFVCLTSVLHHHYLTGDTSLTPVQNVILITKRKNGKKERNKTGIRHVSWLWQLIFKLGCNKLYGTVSICSL